MANNHSGSGLPMLLNQQESTRRRPNQAPLPPPTHAGPSNEMTHPRPPLPMTTNGTALGMNAFGTRAQTQNRTPNTGRARPRPLSGRHPSIEDELGYEILRQPQQGLHVPVSTDQSRRQQQTPPPQSSVPNARRQWQEQIPQPSDLHRPTAPPPSRQEQRPQLPDVDVPIAHEPEALAPVSPTGSDIPSVIHYPSLPVESAVPGPASQQEREQNPLPAPLPARQSEPIAPRRQQQDAQSTFAHEPTAHAPESLQGQQPLDVPGVGERHQAALQASAPAPVPERQNEPVAPRRRQHRPPPIDVEIPITHAPEPLSPRSPRYGRHEAPGPERQNVYSCFMNHLINAAPSIHATLEIAGAWIVTVGNRAESVSKCIFKVVWWAVKFLVFQRTFLKLSLLVLFLAWWLYQHLFGLYVCPSINSFCEYRYNPLSPLICPMKMCASYHPSSGSGATKIMEVVQSLAEEPTPIEYNTTEQQQHICSLFRIPDSMNWSAQSLRELTYFIHRSTLPDPDKENLASELTHITRNIDTTIPQADAFILQYIYYIGIIHKHIQHFEGVFVKTIEEYAATACPDRDFLRHHRTSVAGRQAKIYAMVICPIARIFSNVNSAAGAITKLQSQFEKFVHTSDKHFMRLNDSATTVSSTILPLKNQLTTFSTQVAAVTNEFMLRIHHEQNQGFVWSSFLTKLVTSKQDLGWIDADTIVLNRCEGDFVNAMRVFEDASFRLSRASTAINHLLDRLRSLQAQDVHDGWESASLLIFARELRWFVDWMDGGAEGGLEELRRKVNEEVGRRLKNPMIVPRVAVY